MDTSTLTATDWDKWDVYLDGEVQNADGETVDLDELEKEFDAAVATVKAKLTKLRKMVAIATAE